VRGGDIGQEGGNSLNPDEKNQILSRRKKISEKKWDKRIGTVRRTVTDFIQIKKKIRESLKLCLLMSAGKPRKAAGCVDPNVTCKGTEW